MDATNTMISMIYDDWATARNKSDCPPAEFFQALMQLVQEGKIVAFYDDNDGVVKYSSIQEVS